MDVRYTFDVEGERLLLDEPEVPERLWALSLCPACFLIIWPLSRLVLVVVPLQLSAERLLDWNSAKVNLNVW